MGGTINKLTDLVLKNAKAGVKTRRMSDGGGLFLEIRPNGSRYWRIAYRFDGKQKLLAVGVYPQVSSHDAREKARIAREHLVESSCLSHCIKFRKQNIPPYGQHISN
jgi:hypothetical protein